MVLVISRYTWYRFYKRLGDKYVTISCMACKNLDKKIYILSKNSLEKVVKSKYTIIKELILLC